MNRIGALLVVLVGVSTLSASSAANRLALRQIVQTQCLPHWRQRHDPSPCASVNSDRDGAESYALLHDQKGGAHFLLIPTRTLAGIGSPELLLPSSVNYFALAWEARGALAAAAAAGHPVPRSAVALAVNSAHARGQDQLHIHIECQPTLLHAALRAGAPRLDGHWHAMGLAGHRYLATRIGGPDLAINPFALLAAQVGQSAMANYSLLVAAMGLDAGDGDATGFVILAATRVPGGEALLQSHCPAAP